MNLDSRQWKTFITLMVIGTFAAMDRGMIGLTVNNLQNADYMQRLGMQAWSAAQTGIIVSVVYLSLILVTLPGGYIADRFGYWGFVTASLSILVIGSALFGWVGMSAGSSIFLLLPLARLLTGVGQAGYNSGAAPIIAKNFAAEQRGNVQGQTVATAGVGAIVAYTLGAWVIGIDWRYAYFLLAALFFVGLLMFLFFVPEPKETPTQAAANANQPKVRFSEAWTNRNTLVLALTLLFNNAASMGLLSWMPSMFGQWFQIKGVELTLILCGYAVTMIISSATAAGIIAKRFPNNEKRFTLINSLIGAVFLFLAVCVHKAWGPWAPWLSAALFYLANLGFGWAFGAIVLLPYRVVPLRIVGSAFSVIGIGACIGGIIMGVVTGQIITFLKLNPYISPYYYPWAMTFLAVCSVIAGFMPFLLREPGAQHAAPVPEAAS